MKGGRGGGDLSLFSAILSIEAGDFASYREGEREREREGFWLTCE
jgi:hypothetical protein